MRKFEIRLVLYLLVNNFNLISYYPPHKTVYYSLNLVIYVMLLFCSLSLQ